MIVRELFTTLGLKVDKKSFDQGDRSTNKVADGLKKLASAAVLGVAIRGFSQFIRKQVELADNIGKTSKQLRVQVEALQEMRFAADLAGVEAAQFDQGLALLLKNARDAADGSTEFAEDFDKLGITVTDTNGKLKDGPTLLADFADGMAGLDDEAAKVGLALSLMGRSGRKLLPLLENGAAGIEAMRKEARELGFVLSEEDVAAAEFAKDEFTRLGRVVLGMKQRVFLAVLPSVVEFTHGLIEMGKRAGKFLRNGKLVEVALTLIGVAAEVAGVAATVAFAGPLLTMAKFLLAATAALLIIEDVLVLFSGGKSIVGGFIDAVFGLGAADELIQNHRAGVQEIADAWVLAEGDLLSFVNTLLGTAGDMGSFVDSAMNFGAAIFDFFQSIQIGAARARASTLELAASIPFASEAIKSQAKAARQAANDLALQQGPAASRGRAGFDTSRGEALLLSRTGRRGAALNARLAERQARREGFRRAGAAGRQLEGEDFRDTRLARGRGAGADVEQVRRGVARTSGIAATSTVVEGDRINVDIRGVTDPAEVERRVRRVLDERDQQSRRATRAAVRRTKEAG